MIVRIEPMINFQWDNQNCESAFIVFLLLLLMPFPNLAGVSTHPFLYNFRASAAVTTIPFGAFTSWYTYVSGLFSLFIFTHNAKLTGGGMPSGAAHC